MRQLPVVRASPVSLTMGGGGYRNPLGKLGTTGRGKSGGGARYVHVGYYNVLCFAFNV